MNIGRTIRVLHAEPVGDPRPGDPPVAPPLTPDEVRAETGAGATAGEPAAPDVITSGSAPPQR